MLTMPQVAQVTTGEFLLYNFQTKEMAATLEKGLKQGGYLLS